MSFGVGHESGVDETKVEILVPRVYLRCAAHQALGHELDDMVPLGHRAQKGSARPTVHPRAQQLVHFNDDHVQYDELPAQLCYQGGR